MTETKTNSNTQPFLESPLAHIKRISGDVSNIQYLLSKIYFEPSISNAEFEVRNVIFQLEVVIQKLKKIDFNV